MNSLSSQLPRRGEPPAWYAFRVMHKREKRVAQRLGTAGVECYVPLQRVVRQYASKRKVLSVPLLPHYVFAHITAAEYSRVLGDADVFEVVSFRGEIGRVAAEEIAFLKAVLREGGRDYDVQVHDRFAVGTPVVVAGGALAGTRGHVVAKLGKSNFVVDLRTLGVSLSVHVDARLLEVDNAGRAGG